MSKVGAQYFPESRLQVPVLLSGAKEPSGCRNAPQNKSRGFTAIWGESEEVNRGLGQKSHSK